MNVSGLPVRRFCEYYDTNPNQTLIVYDDMDHECGVLRLKQGGGHGGHNGIADIKRHGYGECWRLRVGIGRPLPMVATSDYVLGVPSQSESQLIEQAIQKALDGFIMMINGDFSELMNDWHQK